MRGGVTVRAQDLKTRLPEDMFGEIREMHPLLTPKLTNATIKRAVRDYLNGGARKQRVVTKYGEIRNWDVSNVTDMDHMFWDAHSFNQPLNNWNVSNVGYMSGMFQGAHSFKDRFGPALTRLSPNPNPNPSLILILTLTRTES